MKIVLAIDGSKFSRAAINELAAMRLLGGTEVCILSVFENPLLTAPGAATLGSPLGNYYEEAVSNARKSAETIVKNAAKSVKDKNPEISITTEVIHGLPKSAILEKSENFGADLIVVGSQGHGAFSRFLLGSVSQSIAMHASCSVLIVRKKSEK
ncbi:MULTISPECIES: universal stress protein [Flagellimonas]|jgi:nucleotide-binding universal stress UspA family protein|uniref:Nucleotide-binding universal stress UspA family protein n=2 Tax=Flagellimonas TaxID=444459 RepID=A0A2T0MF18_9FLAO|nr:MULTISPECIES: universal stress protein [Allomuricauda]MBO0340658.1 universal stress protein [Allomuricauda profundi]PRX56169.1 nucleotide-binding universal stress UspA family protein [Allomuricauda pacifica]